VTGFVLVEAQLIPISDVNQCTQKTQSVSLCFCVLLVTSRYSSRSLDTSRCLPMTTQASKDDSFVHRIQSAIKTVQAWDADPTLLSECRALIPFQDLIPPSPVSIFCIPVASKYQQDDDYLYTGNGLFLKRLTKYFQTDVMTWVNQPPCAVCGAKEMESRGVRGPETQEERQGGAARVERESQYINDSYRLFKIRN
jgi:hypothetical protein